MKAIVTKFHGPSNVKGSRYSATDEDGNRVIVGADHSVHYESNHDAAALALCKKMGWRGTLQRGHVSTGYVYVWISERDQVVAA